MTIDHTSSLAGLVRAHQEQSAPGNGYWATRARDEMARLLTFSTGLPAEFDQIDAFRDEKLTPETLDAAKIAMREATVSRIAQTVRAANETASTALAAADKAAEPYRPKFDPESVAQATRTAQAWEMIVRPQLDAGKEWPEVIATLDADGLLAVERFAPSIESAKRDRFTQHEVPAVLEGIRELTDRRVIHTAPEGPARDAMRELVDVRQLHSSIMRSTTALSAVQGKRDVVGASVAVKRAATDAGATPAAMQAAAAA